MKDLVMAVCLAMDYRVLATRQRGMGRGTKRKVIRRLMARKLRQLRAAHADFDLPDPEEG